MSRNAALGIFGILLVAMVMLWLLKIAFKLILIAAVVFAAIAVFYHIKARFGGGRK